MTKYIVTILVTAAIVGGSTYGFLQLELINQQEGSGETVSSLKQAIDDLTRENTDLLEKIEEKEKNIEQLVIELTALQSQEQQSDEEDATATAGADQVEESEEPENNQEEESTEEDEESTSPSSE